MHSHGLQTSVPTWECGPYEDQLQNHSVHPGSSILKTIIPTLTFFYCYLKISNTIKKWRVIPDSTNWSSDYSNAGFQGKVLDFDGRMLIWILSGCWILTLTLSRTASFSISAVLTFWPARSLLWGPSRVLQGVWQQLWPRPKQNCLPTELNVSRGPNHPQLRTPVPLKGKSHLEDISIALLQKTVSTKLKRFSGPLSKRNKEKKLCISIHLME